MSGGTAHLHVHADRPGPGGRPVNRMRGVRLVVAGLALCLPSCVDFDGMFDICPDGCPPPPPQDCSVLQSAAWRVVPSGSSGNDVRLAVGESRAVSLSPFVESHCAATI